MTLGWRAEEHLPLIAVPVLSIVAIGGFSSTIAGWAFMSSVILGVVGAFIVSLQVRRLDLLVGESLATSLIAFVLLGGVATGGLPTPRSYADFVDGLVNGWTDFLSSAAPVDLTSQVRVLPFALAWWSVMLGTEVLRRTGRPLAAVIGPFAGLSATLLLTVGDDGIGRLQGTAFVAAALLLVVPRRSSLVVVSLVALLAPLLGPRLPLAGSNDRYDLRQVQSRPWNPLDQPSPLVTLKASLKAPRSDDVAFTVHSAEPLLRWSVAVLGSYNGVVWEVADGSTGEVAEFSPVDTWLPSTSQPNSTGPTTSYHVEIHRLDGVWVPVAGSPERADSDLALQLNTSTGTLAAPEGLTAGSIFELSSSPRPELSEADLLRSTVPDFDDSANLELLPPQIRNLSGDLFEGMAPGTERAVAVSERFTAYGFYDAGDTTRPGHSLARIDQFLADPDELVGYEEHYAAAAALLLRSAGVPSRVVVGYRVPSDRFQDGVTEVRVGDISAWIEVLTTEHGWVPLTVSPDRSRTPEQETAGQAVEDIVIPDPPPPPPAEPAATPTSDRADDPNDEDDLQSIDSSSLRAVPIEAVVAGVAIGTPVIGLGFAGVLVVALKHRRRRSRRARGRPADQIGGAWSELVDRYLELGVVTSGPATPTEAINAFIAAVPVDDTVERDLIELAAAIDRASFHPCPPRRQDAVVAWTAMDRASAHLRSKLSFWERLAASTDPRPLLPRHRRRPPMAAAQVATDNRTDRTLQEIAR